MLQKLQLGLALRLTLRTTPILLVRLGAYVGFWVIALVYFAILFGVGSLLANIAGWLGVVVAIFAIGGAYPLYQLANKYVFYIIKAAHIAVVAELLAHGELPAGKSQLAWGREQVVSRFGQVSIMFAVDEIVEGIVKAFTRTVFSIVSFLPGNQSGIFNMLERLIRNAVGYVDEAILARAFWRREESVWQTAQEGVVLYAMCWKPLLTNAVALMLLSYIPFVAALILLAAPVGFLVSLISAPLAAWSIVLVLLLSLLIKAAMGDAFAMTAMLAAYQRETENLVPDPAMEATLNQVTDRFGELKQRALAAATQRGVPGFSSDASPRLNIPPA
jgi:hypothetical protein